MVDNKVHIQQMTSTTGAGYVYIYHLILEEKNSYADFSDSCADKEFWTQQRLENEREILKWRTHEKQISAFSAVAALTS